MIKKSIASILIILIFINSIGCTSYNAVKKDDINSIEEAGKIKLTTVDNKEYILKNVTVTDSTISGNQLVQNYVSERKIEFQVDQIAKIEVEEYNDAKTALLIILTPLAIYGIVKLIDYLNSPELLGDYF
jgi:hypothetical protein